MAERAIRITAGPVVVGARLNESATACAIWDALPIDVKAGGDAEIEERDGYDGALRAWGGHVGAPSRKEPR